MPLRDGWGWHPPQTAFHIHTRHVQSVWGIVMLFLGHMGAPLYCYIGQVVPRFRILGSLGQWKWCHFILVEAHIHLRLLPTSILDIYKVFDPLVCCFTGIWMQHYIIIPATLAPDFEILGHLWSVNDTIAWCLRLTSNSDRPHPYKTCTTYLRYWHAVSKAYRCTLIPFHRPSWPQILEFWVIFGAEMMPLHHGWGSHPPQTAFHIHTRHIQSVWAIGMLSHRHMGSTLYRYTGQ